MKKSWVKEAAIVAAAIVVLAFCIKAGIENFADRGRTVSVKGLSEREVPANKVVWPIVFKEVGNNLQVLYNSINTTSDKIIEYLKANGITDAEISVNAPEVIDFQAERYSTNDKPYRYNIKSVITVTSEQVDKVRTLIASQGELLKEGIAIIGGDYENRITYEYTLLNELKPEMIAEATRNARKAAEQFAKDSDSRLGKIVWASQGQFSITDRDNNTPYIKKVRVVTSVNYSLKN
ncbi:MAG: SIMPL domain-containing protein [Bacteroidales bacterium]|nr:SIMPL domain-containing protein [Bacteroidales bacterium]